MIACQIIRLGLHLRNQVAPHDRHRHGPVGLKLISTIFELTSGDGRSTLPATAVCRAPRRRSRSPRCARRNVAPRETAAGLPLRLRRRTEWCELRQPHLGRNVQRLQRLLAHHAIDRNAMPGLEAPTPIRHRDRRYRTHPHGHQDRRMSSGAGTAPDRRLRPPSRSRSACATSGQPALATMPSDCPIACSVCSTVAGERVGSDAFGVGMVRGRDRTLPESLLWFWSIRA